MLLANKDARPRLISKLLSTTFKIKTGMVQLKSSSPTILSVSLAGNYVLSVNFVLETAMWLKLSREQLRSTDFKNSPLGSSKRWVYHRSGIHLCLKISQLHIKNLLHLSVLVQLPSVVRHSSEEWDMRTSTSSKRKRREAVLYLMKSLKTEHLLKRPCGR